MAEAEITTIARPYARAAFSHALDKPGGLGEWSQMLGMLAAAVNETVVQDALDNPVLTTDDEAALLFSIVGDDLNEEGRNFVSVLAEYDRLAALPAIAEMYDLLKANHEKTMDVEVISAFEVSEQEKSTLANALSTRLQRDINLETEVDNGLIGGVVVKAEDTVIDGSVRGRLAKLSQVLN